MTRYWFISTKYRRGSKFALFTFILAFIVILLGAYTRLTSAGLSCPDWPHCYGYLTAPHTATQLQNAAQQFPSSPVDIKKAWTEMTHRYAAGIESVCVLLLALSFLFTRKAKDMKTTVIGLALIALLGAQIALGMLTVTEKLKPLIVLAHLLVGLSLVSVIWWAYLDLHLQDDSFINKNSPRLIPWLWLAFLIIVLQIALGGWVTTHYASLACVDFPYCNGALIPALHWNNLNLDPITIHMLHRLGALVTACYLGFLALVLLFNSSFRAIATLLLALIGLQIMLGILNIVWMRPVWVALIHQAIATTLLLTIITSLVKAYFEARDYRHGIWIA